MLISIVTPCYNLASYITDTYRSLKAQTYTHWEWVIVDDESTDNTIQIISSFQDERVKLIRSKHYGNLSILRNIGVRESRGEILFFVDGDDLFMEDKVEVQVNLFNQHPEVGWSHTNALTLIDETGELHPRGMRLPPAKTVLTGDEAFKSLTLGNYMYVSSAAVRRNVFLSVGGFNEQYNRCEDIDLWLRLSANGYAVGYISEPKLKYRVRKSGLYSSKQLEYLKTNFVVFNRVKELFPEISAKYRGRISEHFSNIYFKMAIATLRENANSGFRQFFMQSLRNHFTAKKFAWTVMAYLSPALTRSYILKRKSKWI